MPERHISRFEQIKRYMCSRKVCVSVIKMSLLSKVIPILVKLTLKYLYFCVPLMAFIDDGGFSNANSYWNRTGVSLSLEVSMMIFLKVLI